MARKHADRLREEGAPAAFVDQGAAVLDRIQAASAAQELRIDSLPVATASLCETKGKLYGILEKLNRVGRAIRDGDAERAAHYNLDLLQRHGRRASSTTSTSPE